MDTQTPLTARQYFAKLKIGDLFFKNFLNAVRSGNNAVTQSLLTERMIADDSWITEIEGFIFSIEQVIKDPKKSIVDERVVVQVEKAKRVTQESIRHLASHSNLIRSIDEGGNVFPSKILSLFMEEDLLLYENRFVYTLIVRLQAFLEQKHSYLKEYAGTFQSSSLDLKSDFKYKNTQIEYELKLNVKTPQEDSSSISVKRILDRIENLKKRVQVMTGSMFYKALSKTRPLSPPIAKTNIIRLNHDYNNCYKLWLFLSSFINTGYSVKVSDKVFPVEQEYLDDLTYLIAISMKALMANGAYIFNPEDYEEQESREYNVLPKDKYIPLFKFEKGDAKEQDYLNQYYYEKIKDILSASESGGGDFKSLKVERQYAYSFTSFYRQISRINNMIYDEVLSFKQKQPEKALSKAGEKQEELAAVKELYRRSHLLTRLKEIDLRETKNKELKLLSKAKKLQQEIETLKRREKERAAAGKEKVRENSKKEKGKGAKAVIEKPSREKTIKDIIKKDNKISKEILQEKEQ